jgi:hypothetical protein
MGKAGIMQCKHAAANPMAGLQNHYRQSRARELTGRSHAGRPRTNNCDITIANHARVSPLKKTWTESRRNASQASVDAS